jgi:hypothetical protein
LNELPINYDFGGKFKRNSQAEFKMAVIVIRLAVQGVKNLFLWLQPCTNRPYGIDYLSQLKSVSLQRDLASVYERKVESETIQSILDKLPEKYKAVLILYQNRCS